MSKGSGVKHDSNKPPLELIPPVALTEIARALEFGANKYGRYNWCSGMAWSRLIGAAFRHIAAFNDGEDNDPESSLPHLSHAACCIVFLLTYQHLYKEGDDRYKFVTQTKDEV